MATRHPDWQIIVLDNLYRRGSQLNLPRLRAAGVEFVEADVKSVPSSSRSARSTRSSVNVGGGRGNSLSLLETTALCRELRTRLHALTTWRPGKGPQDVLTDFHAWIAENADDLAEALGLRPGVTGLQA